MTGPLSSVWAPVTIPMSWLYGYVVRTRNGRFDRGVGVCTMPAPVVSVGNITAGGTGKSPFVRWVVRGLVDAGRTPVIAMRGYGGKSEGMSDEQAEHAEALGDEVRIVADPKRGPALLRLFAEDPGTADCVVLDDGFQHRMVARDLDIVLIDARQETLDDRLLPAGFLREPIEHLKRADAIVITHAAEVDEALSRRIESIAGQAPIAWCDHVWAGLDVYSGSESCDERPVQWLAGKRLVGAFGIGAPEGIRAQVAHSGAELAAELPAKDHHAYTIEHVQALQRMVDASNRIEALITTGKDWVKLRSLIDFTHWPVPIVVPRLELKFLHGGDALTQRIENAVDRNRNG